MALHQASRDLPPHFQNFKRPSKPEKQFEVVHPLRTGANAQFPEKIRYAKAWEEFLRACGVSFSIDHTIPYNHYIFIHPLDKEHIVKQKISERKKYIATGAFLAASMTGVHINEENNIKRVTADHQGLLVTYSRDGESEKFSIANFQGDINSPRAKTDERYFNNTLIESIKAAFILVQNAKLSGWDSIQTGNTSDPVKLYAIKLACEAIDVKYEGKNISVSDLPKNTVLEEKIAARMQYYVQEYLNFPSDPPRFDQKSIVLSPPSVEMQEAKDTATRRFIMDGFTPYRGTLDIHGKSKEEAVEIAQVANNPLIEEIVKMPYFSRVRYEDAGRPALVLTLANGKSWEKPLNEHGENVTSIHKPKPFEETFKNVLLQKITRIAKNQTDETLTNLFRKINVITYFVERHSVQQIVRDHTGILQVSDYDPAKKQATISISGSCNSSCSKLGNTQNIVETDLKAAFPEDVKNVRFVEVPSMPKIA